MPTPLMVYLMQQTTPDSTRSHSLLGESPGPLGVLPVVWQCMVMCFMVCPHIAHAMHIEGTTNHCYWILVLAVSRRMCTSGLASRAMSGSPKQKRVQCLQIPCGPTISNVGLHISCRIQASKYAPTHPQQIYFLSHHFFMYDFLVSLSFFFPAQCLFFVTPFFLRGFFGWRTV